MRGSVAALLLAAGRSIRMGRCKQLLPLGNTTVLGRCLDTLRRGGVGEIAVVVSADGEQVARAAAGHGVRVVVNPDREGDMASSVRAGRDAFGSAVGGVIVSLCDQPLVAAGTVARLRDRHATEPGRIIIPTHGGRRGHPLLFPLPVLAELEDGLTLRDLVVCDPARVCCVAVADPGILIDMDTPEDYRHVCRLMAPQEGLSLR
ncbi:nucleotidyltransferase family protein [Geobacter sulfurreducens]|uniref:MobA-related glycosyltransferase, putative n=1 Tax=Geobacter sulfurreducens (strain ATCC 51573 / DSM 12127 / PCA) TaxID=243231 RepID=Q74GP3_GEOSL|nr:nucleotidyltransferase family protein [Geobacter sulfurreducens]AAR33537.1 MobA-related glycosyltransferase, putative [Geobacter sulfurreducens PCA]UAC04300.1 nucleotidyltransferase family protein [Geobacter sulfurreducens]HBB68829.1 nucleotidyltransferase family protein [Geobacter sulfurreducens]HCD96948.1 nucleotidyltransferase family protein [Geobacter sulfurreducens]